MLDDSENAGLRSPGKKSGTVTEKAFLKGVPLSWDLSSTAMPTT